MNQLHDLQDVFHIDYAWNIYISIYLYIYIYACVCVYSIGRNFRSQLHRSQTDYVHSVYPIPLEVMNEISAVVQIPSTQLHLYTTISEA